jgi:predicted component of type VI protein secretion system
MGRNNQEAPMLIAQGGPLNEQRWSIKNKITVGRDQDCDIVIPDRQVSRHHLTITPTTDGAFVEDLNSKNGTHYNGVAIEEATRLEDGSVIQIAFVQTFLFISSDATLPLDAGDIIPVVSSQEKLRVDKRSRRVYIEDKELLPPLSVSQYKLLELLYDHQSQVVLRNDLIEYIWSEKEAVLVSDQALDALVRRLRERLSEMDPDHDYIITVRGHGLRLENPE